MFISFRRQTESKVQYIFRAAETLLLLVTKTVDIKIYLHLVRVSVVLPLYRSSEHLKMGVASSGMLFIPSLMKSLQFVQVINVTATQTDVTLINLFELLK